MIPVFKIEANDKDITAKIAQSLSSLSITDQKGYESDSFEMTLVDPNAEISWPTHDVELKIWLGFAGQELHYKGLFIADESEFAGAPDHWSIKARAADFINSTLKAQKSRSWHDNNSLGNIIEFIAKQNGLRPAISKSFYSLMVKHIDQTNESDMNLLTRLGKRYDAVAKVANGFLIFSAAGEGQTASGDDMPLLSLHRNETNDYRFTKAGKPEFTGVVALWHDLKSAIEKKEVVGDEAVAKVLKRKFPSQAEAKNAAQAEFKRLSRSKDTADISIMKGRPDFAAECRVTLSGWRDDIDTDWIVKEVTHELSRSSGLTTRVQLEKFQEPQADAAVDDTDTAVDGEV
jgi:phage protein D